MIELIDAISKLDPKLILLLLTPGGVLVLALLLSYRQVVSQNIVMWSNHLKHIEDCQDDDISSRRDLAEALGQLKQVIADYHGSRGTPRNHVSASSSHRKSRDG